PCYPDPYVRVKELPVKDLIYDLDHDEFLVRPGDVSEDGLIDDQSVVWNWEERLVTMKFREASRSSGLSGRRGTPRTCRRAGPRGTSAADIWTGLIRYNGEF
ncbi:MAG: hypothetical protein IJI07_01610, partial [Flexilinea sp.]|nr:hypothetical protein [Flexilinea sp.]